MFSAHIPSEAAEDFYNNAPCSFLTLDRSGLFVRINRTGLNWLGYQREEMIGQMRLADILSAESREAFQRGMLRLQREGRISDLELLLIRKNGASLPVLVSASVTRDENNFILYDLTQRKKEDARFRRILQALPDAVLICNRDGEIILSNPQIENVLGYSPEGLQGCSLDILLPGRLRWLHRQYLERFFDNPQTRPMGVGMELTALHHSGKEVPVEISLSPMQAGDGLQILAAIRDVTERRHAQAEREHLITQLQEALAQVKVLSGLLPICASCKKICDEHGRWDSVEKYIHEHSGANFTHGICPECSQQLYPELHKK
jgi:PAS domain S-box-containing protein